MKDFFFDTDKVSKLLDRASKKALSKAGAFVRTSSRRSLRRRKAASRAGQTPSVHSKDGYATLKNILFAYDPARQSVIVGPVGFGSSGAPRTLELGGSTRVRVKQPPRIKSGRRASPAQAASFRRKIKDGTLRRQAPSLRSVSVAARPFMVPALKREAPKFPGLWAGSVK